MFKLFSRHENEVVLKAKERAKELTDKAEQYRETLDDKKLYRRIKKYAKKEAKAIIKSAKQFAKEMPEQEYPDLVNMIDQISIQEKMEEVIDMAYDKPEFNVSEIAGRLSKLFSSPLFIALLGLAVLLVFPISIGLFIPIIVCLGMFCVFIKLKRVQ